MFHPSFSILYTILFRNRILLHNLKEGATQYVAIFYRVSCLYTENFQYLLSNEKTFIFFLKERVKLQFIFPRYWFLLAECWILWTSELYRYHCTVWVKIETSCIDVISKKCAAKVLQLPKREEYFLLKILQKVILIKSYYFFLSLVSPTYSLKV